MIFQGLFNILDLYFNQIDLFYDNIEKYFRDKIYEINGESSFEKDLNVILEKLLSHLKEKFIELRFDPEEIENNFLNLLIEIKKRKIKKVGSTLELFKLILPIIYEIFLKKIFDYIVNDQNAASTMMYLRSKELLPIEFIMELRNLKMFFEKSPIKTQSLKKYLQIPSKIVQKLKENKENIEQVEDLKDPRDKLQLFYMVYRIIDFFGIQQFFDFSHIIEYIQNNMEDWLDTIPLVSLKNPDIYFCGIYLAKNLSIEIDEDMVSYYLLNIYDENIDEFESPIVEATNQVYYFFKSAWLVDLELSEEQINELLKGEGRFFETNYLRNLETSQLVIILKIYNVLGLYHKIDPHKIKTLIDEIGKRITSDGIKQFRDGFISSEATYHVLFNNYMRKNLKSLRDYANLIEIIVSRIYRNLGILKFSTDINYDLVSELYYSCESLKLLNCIERKNVLIHIARYLFPEIIVDKILKGDEVLHTTEKFRHLKVSRTTGETVY